MNILMVAPKFGGINVYVKALVNEMRAYPDVNVQWIGSDENDFPFDKSSNMWRDSNWTEKKASEIAKLIDPLKWDVICYHYGKNDLEQLLPALVPHNTKQTYFVHYLTRLLFKKYIPNEYLHRKVENATQSEFDDYIFFGSYAKDEMSQKILSPHIEKISFLPETHSDQIITRNEYAIFDKEFPWHKENRKTVYILGYGSAYKDYQTILDSLNLVNSKMNIVFVGAGWERRLGFTNSHIGNVSIFVIDKEIDPKRFLYLVKNSLFGIFSYKKPGTCNGIEETFQGSGVLPNYIYNGKSTIVSDEGCLAEYVGNSGIVFNGGDSIALGNHINRLLDDEIRKEFEKKAKIRSHLFSMKNHCSEVIKNIYKLKNI